MNIKKLIPSKNADSGSNQKIIDILGSADFSYADFQEHIVREKHALISPKSDIGRIIDAKMRLIAEKLLPGWNFDTLHFVLMDSKDINALYHKPDEILPEFIGITKGAIEFCKTEDEFVSFIAHELGHRYRNHRVGEGNNTRGEEIFSEVWLMERMHECGWNPEGVYRVISRLSSRDLLHQIREIFDVHGLSSSMLTSVKNALIYVKKQKGSLPNNNIFSEQQELANMKIEYSSQIITKIAEQLDGSTKIDLLQEYCKEYFASIDLFKKNNYENTPEYFSILKNIEYLNYFLEQSLIDNTLSSDAIFAIADTLPEIYRDNNILPSLITYYKNTISHVDSLPTYIEVVSKMPQNIRTSREIGILLYQKLKEFEQISLTEMNTQNSRTYNSLLELFTHNLEMMCVYQIKKMIHNAIGVKIKNDNYDIMSIVRYAKSREEIVCKVLQGEDIIQVLIAGIKLGKIKISDIDIIIDTISYDGKEKLNIQIALSTYMNKEKPINASINDDEVKVVSNNMKLHIDPSQKEKKLQAACERIMEYGRDLNVGPDDLDAIDVRINKLVMYYEQLLLIDAKNIDFISKNIIRFLQESESTHYKYNTWKKIVGFIKKHIDDLGEENVDEILHIIGFYNFILDYNFGYLTFHHLLFIGDVIGDILKDEYVDTKLVAKYEAENIIDDFYKKQVDMYASYDFKSPNSFGYRIKQIIGYTKGHSVSSTNELIHSITDLPYWKPPISIDNYSPGEDVYFGLKRESFKKKIEYIFLQEHSQYKDLGVLIPFYISLLDVGILSESREAEGYILHKIITLLGEKDYHSQFKYITTILKHHTIEIAEYRISLHTTLINSIQELIASNIYTFVEICDILKDFSLIDKYSIIDQVSQKLITQSSNSDYAKKTIFSGLANQSTINQIDSSVFKDQISVMLMAEVDNKKAVVNYLLSDGDQDSLDELTIELIAKDRMNLFMTAVDSLKSKSSSEFGSFIGDAEIAISSALSEDREEDKIMSLIIKIKDEKDIKSYRDLIKTHREVALAEEAYSTQAKIYRQNYRSSPFWIRALLLDHLVNHQSEFDSYTERKGYVSTINDMEQYLYEKIIATILPQKTKYSESCKVVFDAYYSLLERYERTMFLSAIIAGSEKSTSQSGDEQLGSILAHVLGSMGPAETKFGQSLHSYPSTPEEISSSLYRLKSHANIPPMREIREMLNNPAIIPSEIRNEIEEITCVLAGSIHITLICKTNNNQQRVLTIQRLNALERIKEGFRIIVGVIKKVGDNKDFTYLAHHANTILEEAKHITENELNQDIMKEQYIVANEIYDGSSVNYNAINTSFEVPILLAYGKGYKYITYLPGAHFNEIAQSDIISNDVKKSYAKIILFKELLLEFQGKNTDKDRHGDNVRIDFDKGIIGNFDFGGLTLVETTTYQKELFGQLITQIYSSYMNKGGEGMSIFLDVIDSFIMQYPLERQYFARLQQRLLSLGDYFKILSLDDLQEVIIGILGQELDPIIKESIEKGVGLPLSLLTGMSKFSISYKPKSDIIIPQHIEPAISDKKFDPLKDFL